MDTDEFLTMIGERALANPPTTRNSYDLAARALAEGIPGDFVECGVFAGSQCAAMARAILDARRQGFVPRIVHAFDSFKGIPIAGPNDEEQPGAPLMRDRSGALVSSGVSICNEFQLLSHWDAWGLPAQLLRVYPGWFQETVSQWGGGPIAVLRLDGDLYESTRVCLEALYPHLSSGGFCIIDDYALPGCAKAVEEYVNQGHVDPDGDLTYHVIEGGGGPVWWRKP